MGIYNVGGMHYNRDTTTKGNKLHTLQWVIVEAEDEQVAADIAEGLLNEEMGSGDNTSTWYDWFVVGGGRWNPEQDQYSNSSNMVISYDRDPNAFSGKLQELIADRIDTYNQYLAEVKEQDIMAKLENYGGVMTYDPSLYAFSRLIEYQQGVWNWDSKFLDFTTYSTNATHILARISSHQIESPEKVLGIYLVPVDFHF